MIRFELDDETGVAELVLDRPKVNAMDHAFLGAMADAFARVERDDSVRGVLLRGEGRCFSAGLDLRQVVELERAPLTAFLVDFDRAFLGAFRCSKPVAAAVEGHAIAGGAVLALCADFLALAPGEYALGLTELKVGVPFPESAWQIVATALPPRGLRALVYGAGLHPPAEAFALGVGDVLLDDPVAAARAWLSQTLARPQATFSLVKQKLRAPACERIDAHAEADRARVVEALLHQEVRAALASALKR